MLVKGIHNLLFANEYAVQLPHMLHQAYLGNWSEVAQAISPSYSSDAPAPDWSIMNLIILCNEDWAKIGREESIQFSAGAYMGYEDVRRNQFVSAFIEKGTTIELNTSCLEDVPLPGFNLNK